jgi:hypothetical protein
LAHELAVESECSKTWNAFHAGSPGKMPRLYVSQDGRRYIFRQALSHPKVFSASVGVSLGDFPSASFLEAFLKRGRHTASPSANPAGQGHAQLATFNLQPATTLPARLLTPLR